jgi:hypothetical protein
MMGREFMARVGGCRRHVADHDACEAASPSTSRWRVSGLRLAAVRCPFSPLPVPGEAHAGRRHAGEGLSSCASARAALTSAIVKAAAAIAAHSQSLCRVISPSLSIPGLKDIRSRSRLNWRVRFVRSPREEGRRLDPVNLPISSNVIGSRHLVRRRRDASQRPGLCRYPHQEP